MPPRETRRVDRDRSLLAWQACRDLTKAVYAATRGFPAEERFGLSSQLRRAAVSAAGNIAEGYARTGARGTAHGLSVALGSLAEVDTLLAVAEDAGLLGPERVADLYALLNRASQLTAGLLRRLQHRG